MGDVNQVVPTIAINPLISGETKKRGGLDFRVYQDLKTGIHRDLLNKVDLEKVATQRDDRTRRQVFGVIQDLVANLKTPLSGPEKERLSLEVLDEVFGLGPLEPLLQDPTISDILVNGSKEVYVERAGMLEETKIMFKDDALSNQTLTKPMLDLLKAAVASRLNIVISGGTGAGKTTFLNVLSGFISERERIVTIEDSAELQMKQKHVVRLECRPANVEGKGAVHQRQLVINSLRMRPNRIVVGEVRGEEALDMLQAMNTGHDGSLTTVHANSPRDAIARVETM